MESYEASRAIFTKIQIIDPQNASKIMGYILLNHGENDMKHLAFASENILLSVVNKAKAHLGLSSNTSRALLKTPISISRPDPLSITLPSPGLSNNFDPTSPSSPSIWSPNYVPLNPNNNNNNNILLDDFQLKDPNFSPFLNDPLNLPGKNVDFCDQNLEFSINNNNFYHGKSLSFDDSLPYYGCGYYDNDDDDNYGVNHGSNCSYDVNYEQCQEEIFRAKLAQRHRLAAQLVANNKFNFLQSEAQRSAAALMMNDDFHKLNRARMARNELLGWDCNPGSRQIYLTFPADSTFSEEDVSCYFNKFGPVQDVRIPYQPKRMFGFVTFVFPETVKIILSKGNPHFVCDSRVLVKPYKEKGKLPDKKHLQHQFERGEFSCTSPSEHDCRDLYDFPPGGRMMYSTQEMLLRKKLEEQAEFQHALELQERKLMNLQLLNLKKQQHQHNVSFESPVSLANISSQLSINQTSLSSSDQISQDVTEENKASPTEGVDELISVGAGSGGPSGGNDNVPKKEGRSPKRVQDELFKSLDHALPENLFASPTNSLDIRPAAFSPALSNLDDNAAIPGASLTSDDNSTQPALSSFDTAPLKSRFSETPRISNGNGTLEM